MLSKSKLSKEDHYLLLKDYKSQFRILTLYPTYKCNARCRYCHIWGDSGWANEQPLEKVNLQIDFEALKKFINEIIEYNNNEPFQIVLAGGEPLLYYKFTELIHFLMEKFLPVIILTNGSKLMDYGKTLVNFSVQSLAISLDTIESTHDLVCKHNGLFKKVCEGIEHINAIKIKKNSVLPALFLNCVISESNVDDLEDFISYLKEYFKKRNIKLTFNANEPPQANLVYVRFCPVSFTTIDRGLKYEKEMQEFLNCNVSSDWKGFAKEKPNINVNTAKPFLQKLWKENNVRYEDYVDIEEWFSNAENTFGHYRCFAPWHYLILKPDGNTFLCADLKDYSIGNIFNSTFKEIWEGDSADKFRNHLRNNVFSICSRCCYLYMDFNETNEQLRIFKYLKKMILNKLVNINKG